MYKYQSIILILDRDNAKKTSENSKSILKSPENGFLDPEDSLNFNIIDHILTFGIETNLGILR